jgi:REP-associated tyrosine transposase
MPWGLRRFQNTHQTHFVTFCCYHRQSLLNTNASRKTFESALERVRRAFKLRVYGYVVMPEHVHLLLSEPERRTLADALKSLKQCVSRRLIGDLRINGNIVGGPLKPAFGLSGGLKHFWQKRYYDFNIRSYSQFLEKLRYIHRNPVKAGLCERPEDWDWSSFRHYATGCEGRVEIESEWTARKRERAAGRLCPSVQLPHSSQNPA